MKKSPLLLNLGLLLATWTVSVAGPLAAQFEAPRPSPKATVTQRIGLTDFALSYSRPSVKGRAIWGALVPYDKPWRTGANEATTLTFGDEITVEGKRLAAGTYSLVTIPGKDEWTVIFNTDTALWAQTDYAEAKDVLRVKVKPQAAENRETLQIGFDNLTATSGELAIAWEKLRIPVKVEVEVRNKAIAKAREAVAKAKADDWETPLAVGRYFADEKISLAAQGAAQVQAAHATSPATIIP